MQMERICGQKRWLIFWPDRSRDAPHGQLLTAVYFLCGLRYSDEQIESLFKDLSMTLEDSTTYQLILNKGLKQGVAQGALEEGRRILLRQGAKRFGAASAEQTAAVQAISDRERLERMAERVIDAIDWNDLLATQ